MRRRNATVRRRNLDRLGRFGGRRAFGRFGMDVVLGLITFHVGLHHVVDLGFARQARFLGADQSLRLDGLIRLAAIECRFARLGNDVAGKDFPRLLVGFRRRSPDPPGGAVSSGPSPSVTWTTCSAGRASRRDDLDRGGVAGHQQVGEQRHGHALAQRLILPPTRVHQEGQAAVKKTNPSHKTAITGSMLARDSSRRSSRKVLMA